MDAIITALGTAFEFLTTAFTWIIGNPLMLFFIACSLIPVGFQIFGSAKQSVS